jgi:hypothetical protein
MARLLRSAAVAVLALLPAVAWAAPPGAGTTPGTPGLWLARDKHGGMEGYRGACERAAQDRGWRVRSVGKQTKMEGPNGGTWSVLLRVRDGRHSFEALCRAAADGSDVTLMRRD